MAGNTAEEMLVTEERLTEFREAGFDMTAPEADDPTADAAADAALVGSTYGTGFVDPAAGRAALDILINNAQHSGSVESVRPTNSASHDRAMGGSAGRTGENRDEAYYRWLYDQLAQRLRDLRADIVYYDGQIGIRKAEMETNKVRIEANKLLASGFKADIAALKQGKFPERNSDGSLKDAAKEKMIAEYEKTYGKIDRNDREQMQRAMEWALQQVEDQARRDEARNAQLQTEIDDFERRKRETQDLIKGAEQEQAGAAQKAGRGALVAVTTGNETAVVQAQQAEYLADTEGSDEWDFGAENEEASIALTKSAAATIQDNGMNVENLRGAFGAVRGEAVTNNEPVQVADSSLKVKLPSNSA